MQAIGIAAAVIGAVLIAVAFRRARDAGTGVAEGPPPPGRARGLMARGIGLLLAGAVMAVAGGV